MQRRTFVGAVFAGLGTPRPAKPKSGDIPTRVLGRTGAKLTVIGQGGARFFVQAFGVACFTHVDGYIDQDLDEGQAGLAMNLPDQVAVLAVGANEAGERNHAGIGEESGDLADAADILLTVGRGKTQIPVQAVADIVAVEHIGQLTAFDQGMLEGESDGALAGTAESGEPDGCPILGEQFLPVLALDVPFVPGDVGCTYFGHFSLPSDHDMLRMHRMKLHSQVNAIRDNPTNI